MSPRALALALLLLACSGAKKAPPATTPTLVCNGHAELCDRSYNAVAYPGTHDSYSDTAEQFGAPDQTHPIFRQLDEGIRVLHLEVHVNAGEVDVCHAYCEVGHKPFADEMKAVADFVTAHPNEVVTLLLERSDSVVTADDLGNAMVAAGLKPFMHTQAVGAPWPTLRAMITHGDRVVALLDNPDGSSFPWLLPRWQLTWETPWDNQTPTDFGRCSADRGTQGNSLYVVDTYLEDLAIQSAQHALLVNYDPFLIDRVLTCQRATNTLPNFVMINFYEVSDVLHVVDVLNGFASPPDSIANFPPPVFEDGGGVALPDGGAQ
jgi:hypothetical protein